MKISRKTAYKFICTFLLLLATWSAQAQTGASSMVFRFTKQVWLNPTIILAKQNFEQSTNVKLLILPRLNSSDSSGNKRIEKAFDMLLSFLVYKENVQGSIKFYFNPKNPTKPFSFGWSDELHCKFTPLQKDSVETILNQGIVNSNNLDNFTALPFDSLVTRASRYCKKVLLSKPGACGPNSENEFTLAKINSTPAKLDVERSVQSDLPRNGGVDKLKYPELAQNYNSVIDIADNSQYNIAWKAFEANKSDKVKLKLKKKQPGFDIANLKFKNAQGNVTYNTNPLNTTDSSVTFNISGFSPGSMAEIVAYYTPTTTPTQTFAIGAFNAQFYEAKTYKVVLVNLGGASLPNENAVRDTLNKIYGSVFITWQVSTVTCSLSPSISKTIHVGSSGLLSNYMPDMQPVLDHFKNNCSVYNGNAEDTYYLLFGCTNDSDPQNKLTGYMPRARNTGFIFDTDPRTVAHELGHGAFNLRHIFSSEELGEGARKQTDNLMDYAEGSRLYKHQWDLIHDPAFVSWFAGDDDEGSSVTFANIAAFDALKNAGNNTYTFISPSGNYITLPPDVKSVRFSTFDRLFAIINNTANMNAPTDNVIPFGALSSFTDKNGNVYSTRIEGGVFKGYRQTNSQTETYYKDRYTRTLNPTNGISTFVGFKNGSYVFYASTFQSIKPSPDNTDSLSSGPLLKEFSIVGFSPADLDATLQAALTQKKKNAQLLELTSGTFVLTNADISLSYLGSTKTVGQFLIDVLKDTSKIRDYLAYFTLVNMKANEFQGFANCLGQAFEMDMTQLSMSVHMAATKATYGESGRLYEAADIYNNIKVKTLEELVATAQGNMTVVNLLKNGVASGKTAQELYTIIVQNFNRCAMVGIDINTRLAVLRKFVGANYNNDHWYTDPGMFYIDDGGFILDGLITTTPAYDRIKLLKEGFMADDYLWLRNMWSEANTMANGVSYEDVTSVLQEISVWVNVYFKDLQIPITTKTEMVGDIPSFQSYEYPVGTREFYIGMSSGHNVDFQTGYEIYPGYQPADISFESSGKVHFKQDFIFSENYLVVSQTGGPSPYKRYHAYYDETMNPFEPVKVIVAKNFAELGFTAGNEFTVPAYIAMIYQRNTERQVRDQRLRLVGDGIMIAAAVLTAPMSGGGSLATLTTFVTTAGGITSALDIAIQTEKSGLTPEQLQNNAGFYEAWDQFKLTVDIANLGVGVANVAPRVYSFARNFNAARTWNNVNNICKTNLSNLSLKAKNAWNSIKGVTILSEDVLLVTINRLNLANLRSKINLLTPVVKAKFCDDFVTISEQGLIAMDNDTRIVDLWVKYGAQFKSTNYVTETGLFKTCESAAQAHPDGYLGNLVQKVMDARIPSNQEQVVVGVTHPNFNGEVMLGYNFKTVEATEEAVFLAGGPNGCHPLILDRIKYMDFIRTSVTDANGNVINTVLANKLLSVDNMSKLTSAGRAGFHGEIRALSQALYKMEQYQVVTEQHLAEFDLFIRNSSNKIMQRCPCCFYISNGVKVLEGK